MVPHFSFPPLAFGGRKLMPIWRERERPGLGELSRHHRSFWRQLQGASEECSRRLTEASSTNVISCGLEDASWYFTSFYFAFSSGLHKTWGASLIRRRNRADVLSWSGYRLEITLTGSGPRGRGRGRWRTLTKLYNHNGLIKWIPRWRVRRERERETRLEKV